MTFARLRHRLANLLVPQHTNRHGFPSEWPVYMEKQKAFLESLPLLVSVGERTFLREFEAQPNERVVFGLGFLAWEDFEDIQVLAGNGRGFGCQKILRGMYERVLTAARLTEHPDEIQRFVEWHYVNDYKLARVIHETFGESVISTELLAQKKAKRDSVSHAFTRTCSEKDCGRTLPSFSWTNLDVVALSKKCEGFANIIGEGYYIPMVHTHPSMQAILDRLDADGFMGNPERQRRWVRPVLAAAHYLTLLSVETQLKQFPDLRATVEKDHARCVTEYGEMWGKVDPSA